MHMNNARYLRHLDYGRTDFWIRNGVYKVSRQLTNEKTGKKGCPVVLASITTRFRRELRLFQTFSVRTKLLCWDDKAFYVEQQFVSKGFVHCIALIKQVVVGTSPAKVLAALGHDGIVSPPMPSGVKSWVEYDSWSSQEILNTASEEAAASSKTKKTKKYE
ncbi:Mesenchymal stem cell protein DSCD75 family protein [Acanthamoeba castellanii str. Neff]|uniref:Mesenchymal stem cell protein DSCD75 family protein n=1 Tax=Acanthamoeba castellanii (strain ATCC 30010 / Neff) TaxID=1257118 RepID=L8GYN0_ACACF|nr:Mesenchymal stem cell protein DSCD75 family protein [Acanthamoeba castellanii str. Neff]ELR18394.1 Mesenchymal stem cell protein DSCD75 family protein [Acanthamoeba castellanii str. Neff]